MADPNDVLASLIGSMQPSANPKMDSPLQQMMSTAANVQNAPAVPVPPMDNQPQGNPQALTSLMQQAGTPPMVKGGSPQRDPNAAPTMAGRRPNIVNLVQGLFNPAKGTPAGERVPSRTDVFENFIGQFMNSFGQGLQAAGHGPGANLRGLGAGITAPYRQDVQEFQQRQQAQAQQAAIESERAKTEQIKSMGEIVQTPIGPMSKSLAMKIMPAYVGGQAKVESAKISKRFMAVPGVGMLDTQAPGGPAMVPGTDAKGVIVTKQIAEDYNIPEQLIGQKIPLPQFSAVERGGAAQWATVQGAEGPALVNKGSGKTVDLKLGNPHQVANQIAAGKLALSQKIFERDTFGTLYGKDIPSSLVDIDGNTIGWKSPASPVGSIKQQGQQAQDMLKLFGSVSDEITKAQKSGKLGPFAGRLNELMTGKIGADDPQFAKLRALGSLTASGMLKAHFGARGGQEMYKHFEDLFNTGKMTPGDLNGAIDGFKVFMKEYADRVKTAGQRNTENQTAKPAANKHADIGFVPDNQP